MNKTYEKGEILEIEIVDFGKNGEGIGKAGDFVVFVKGAVPKDVITVQLYEVKKNFGFGNVVKFIKMSEDRVEPSCSNFSICGGCTFLNYDYSAEIALKKKKVNDAIKRIGGIDFVIDDVYAMDNPYHYRNKAVFHVSEQKGKINIGFYGSKTRDIVPVSGCVMYNEAFERIAAAVKTYMEECRVKPYNYKSGEGLIKAVMIRQSASRGDILVSIIAVSKNLPNNAGLIYYVTESVKGIENAAIKGINVCVSKSRNREVLSGETKFIYGDSYIMDKIFDLEFKISANSFFQINKNMTETLYGKVLDYAAPEEGNCIIDAYSGTGTIALSLASKAGSVKAIEINKDANADAISNARINGIENVEFIEGDSGRVLEQIDKDDVSADTVILDPPRGGCSKYVIEGVRKLSPERIVYVSCDPATLARDMKEFAGFGYAPRKGCVVDMFGRCEHVESVIMMSRGKL